MSHTTNVSPHPERIRARVFEGTLRRVTRMYAAGLADVFNETLQNSRRAGATRVRVTIEEASGAQAITITDDGAGVADPAVLLSFGENGWSEDLARREDAAGMGFLSLARRGCTVVSRPRSDGGETAPAWRVDLTPAHFLGEKEADILLGADAPRPHGTAVRFRTEEAREAVRRTLENAVRHYPLTVALNGETVPRKAFLDGAAHTESWRGLTFGVFTGRSRYRDEPDLNFHGLIVPVRLPTVHPVDGPAWSVRAEVENCPGLELVLPARKEAVETPFLEEMREAARVRGLPGHGQGRSRAGRRIRGLEARADGRGRTFRTRPCASPLAASRRRYRQLARGTRTRTPARRRARCGCGPGTARSPGAVARRRARRHGREALRGRPQVRRICLVRRAPPRK